MLLRTCLPQPSSQPRGLLILHVRVDVKRLREEGKRYPWPRPRRCPRCKGRLWGHGYVLRYFEECWALWMKRWRCPDCRAVHTARPRRHCPRFRYGIGTILKTLRTKIREDRWTPLSHQLQLYWWRGLQVQCSRILNVRLPDWADVRALLNRHLIPVTHAVQCETRRL
jgi:hypothetical protein